MVVAACETAAPKPGFPELTFAHLAPISLGVARIEVVQAYKAPGARPNVEHLFPVAPATVAERWARQRLKAVGGDGRVRATVVNAAVIEVPLKRSTGLKGMITRDQSERYDGVIEMKLDIVARGGRERASVTVRTELSRSVSEDISLHDREKLWFEMTEEMANKLNVLLEREIRKNFKAYLR
ncbi:MAG: hypothetical protein ACTSQV_01195 [Alphaproteobacteria bacterium]